MAAPSNTKLTMVVVVVVLMTVVCIATAAGSAATPPPHIVFVVADDLGWNDVSFRATDMHTPNIDRMAREGIILNSSYVQPLCSPSRSAWMSGFFPFHTGLQHAVINDRQKAYLPGNLTTLPQVLKTQGYATHAVGKWHLGFCNWKYTPTYRGFDTFLGYYSAEEDYYTHNRSLGYDFRNNTEVDRDAIGEYSAYLFARHTENIIRDHKKEQPLFLYMPFQSVHEPLEVPQVYIDNYCSHIRNESRRIKCGMVAALDDAFGNVTSLLDTLGYTDNMLLIFTTDNGGPVPFAGNNWPLRGSKATLWEGGTRATAFVWSKNLLPKTGYTNNGMMHAVDWFPTIIDAAGAKLVPYRIDGMSQWDTIRLNKASPRTEFVYNIDRLSNMAAIRMGDYKLLQGSTGGHNGWYPVPGVDDVHVEENDYKPPNNTNQLFNVKDDPEERRDLTESAPDVLDKMTKRLEEWRATGVPANFPPPDPASDPSHWGGAWSPGWC
ncbi:hypothetical protein BaRGS_00031859 [Batillaria attramentaria]|uniref:Sulfatase N-terminal domain-containing protein n=1 Tax=Batillaria attramentaria TaxID=370345 RepID=A0ABD0JQL5_9CAEN